MKKIKKKKNNKRLFLKNILINLSIGLIVFIVFLVIIEIGLRIFYPMTLEHPIFDDDKHYFRYKFNSSIVWRSPQLFVNEYTLPYTRNSKGFQDVDHNYSNPENKLRIVGIGDSFTEGGATYQNQTFLYLLEKNLDKADEKKKHEVIKLGISGMDPDEYYFVYKNEGKYYNPKYVVMGFFIGNDIVTSYKTMEVTDNGVFEKNPPQEQSWFLRLRLNLRRNSELYVFAINLLQSNKFTSDFLIKTGFFVPTKVDIYWTTSRENFIQGMNLTLKTLKETDKLCEQNNATLIVMLIPTKEQVDDARYDQFFASRGITPYNGRTEAQDIINNFCLKNNIVCLDLLPELRKLNKNNTFYYNIDGHFNAEGHRVTSEILAKKILDIEKYNN